MTSIKMPIRKAAFLVGSATTVIGGNCIASALALYNSGGADVTITPKDGSGRILSPQIVAAGKTVWLDFSNVVKGPGFFFDKGLSLFASTANVVNAWLAGYEQANVIPPYASEILLPAVTLGLTNNIVARDAMISGLGLHNTHNAIVTVTPKDGNGRSMGPIPIDPGETAMLDWANISDGMGFFFEGGLRMLADVADKVNLFPAGFTQVAV